MNHLRFLTLAGALVLPAVGAAQTAPATLPAAEEPVIVLSPFEISSERDTGYVAANSLAGGRLSTSLQELASSVSVMTRDFLDDIAATDLSTAAQYFPNALPLTPSPLSDYSVSVRGFPSGFLYRNFFISYVNPDSYITERLDSARGPNALVFGDTKAGGTLNVSTKQAKLRNFGSVSYRYSSEGGFGRATLDVNRKLTENLAIRVAGLFQDEDDWVDSTYIKRSGLFGTVTWTPFRNTKVRLEAETYRQDSSVRFFGSVLRDDLGAWDGTTTYTAANQPLVTGSGTSRISANYHVYSPGSAGIVTWSNFAQTSGTGYQLDVNRPAYVSSGVPVLPYRGYNIRLGDDHDTTLTHDVVALTVEQRVGENLFLEVAGNVAEQLRDQQQLAAEGIRVDINRNLPDGSVNPNFGKRYTETGQYGITRQANTLHEGRITAAYVADFGWSSHRFLLGGAYRRDAYRDTSRQVMRDVPGARFQNPFANPNSLRLRIYEDQRGRSASLVPEGAISGVWNFFPGEDKDLYSGQVAASSKWFRDGRLTTLIGIRHDKLRKKRVTANVDPVTGEFTSYNERLDGDDFKPVITRNAGAVYRLTEWLSPYASYSEGYDTSNVGFLLNPETGVPDTPLPSKDSKGWEVGAKLSLWDGRIVGSVAYYQNEQTNDNNTGVTFPRNEINRLWTVIDPARQVPTGPAEVIDYEGDGVELEVVVNPTRNWRTSFNLSLPQTERTGGFARTLAYYDNNIALWESTLANLVAAGDSRATSFRNDLQTIQGRLASVANGRPLTGTVDFTANVFTNYEFSAGRLKGLRIGGGANIRGERFVVYQQRVPGLGNENTFTEIRTKGYEIVNFMAGYRTRVFGQNVDFQLNVDNVFDEYFKRYTSFNSVQLADGSFVLNGNNYVFNGSPRRFILSATVRF